jgi:uncharacterized lipoprotein YddW (UPF0748 family)
MVRVLFTVAALMMPAVGSAQRAPSVCEEAAQPPLPMAEPGDSLAPPPVAREFRGAWVATVGNIDWPSRPGLATWEQQSELLTILDRAVTLHLNAIILQVRPAADAFFPSKIEPWSEFLTGRMGRAPEPLWDPLEFAIREAHARGLELHAWFNPFRAHVPADTGPVARTHVSVKYPSMVRKYGPMQWLDPGDPATRRYSIRAIMDVVKRYDIDAVHIDDYFYPYPEPNSRGKMIEFPDAATYRAYRKDGGKLARDDWRRRNVDLFVEALYKSVKEAKPWVRVGISPFGIWRPGNPPSVRGLDSYTEIFADSRKWLENGWLDYVAPQLYWQISRPEQSYVDLLAWWSEQNVKGRNLWPGNYTVQVGVIEGWTATEILDQVRLTRQQCGASGNIQFSMAALMSGHDSVGDRLGAELYAEPALVPASPWLDQTRPPRPIVEVSTDSVSGESVVRMRLEGKQTAWQWVVQTRSNGEWTTAILPGDQRTHALVGVEAASDAVSVTAINRVGNASRPGIVRRSAAGG